MDKRLSRRRLIAGGVAAAIGATVGSRLVHRYGLIPPDHGGFYGVGETLTYATQHFVTRHSLAHEFNPSEISNKVAISGRHPRTDAYERLRGNNFVDWRLVVDGLVKYPSSFSLDVIKGFPKRTSITQLACEEGWSYIAAWSGVNLSDLLSAVGFLPQAKWVVFFPFDSAWDSLDLGEALHPQTLLAYEMNGNPLPTDHGAPLRLRVPRQLGYKSVKYLSRITITDSLDDIGSGLGSSSPDIGYSWYAGI